MSDIARHDIQAELARVCHGLVASSQWWVAYSGGLDSAVLLHAITHYISSLDQDSRPVLRVIHINHGLSPHAYQWQQHCVEQSRALGLSCEVVAVQVENTGQGIESEARLRRYRAFAKHLGPDDILLTGHHGDDQVETFFLRMMRGAGIAGLGAMRRWSQVYGCNIFRPLLSLSRTDLEAYARQQSLQWVDDESNDDEGFSRNYLRHQVMPVLQAKWPQYRQSIARSAQWCREADMLLAEYAQTDLEALLRCHRWGMFMALTDLQALSEPRCKAVLLRWLKTRGLSVPRVADWPPILAAIAHHTQGCCLTFANYRLIIFQSALYIVEGHLATLQGRLPYRYRIDTLPFSVSLPYGVLTIVAPEGVDAAVIEVRSRVGGERCRVVGRGGSRSVKKLLLEAAVPIWLRSFVPLVYVDDELFSVADVYMTQSSQKVDQIKLQIHWRIEADCADIS